MGCEGGVCSPVAFVPGYGVVVLGSGEDIHVPVPIHVRRIERAGAVRASGDDVWREGGVCSAVHCKLLDTRRGRDCCRWRLCLDCGNEVEGPERGQRRQQ